MKEDNVYKTLSTALGTVEKYLHKHLTVIIVMRNTGARGKPEPGLRDKIPDAQVNLNFGFPRHSFWYKYVPHNIWNILILKRYVLFT